MGEREGEKEREENKTSMEEFDMAGNRWVTLPVDDACPIGSDRPLKNYRESPAHLRLPLDKERETKQNEKKQRVGEERERDKTKAM